MLRDPKTNGIYTTNYKKKLLITVFLNMFKNSNSSFFHFQNNQLCGRSQIVETRRLGRPSAAALFAHSFIRPCLKASFLFNI